MYYIGVDLGGTNIAVGLVTKSGELIRKDSVPTLRHRTAEEVIKDMANLCLKVVSDAGLEITDIMSIGVGSPGIPDPVNGVLLYANNLNFNNTPIRAEMQKYINLPIYIENDANCAALGENTSGAAKGYKNSITITLGTGVGGGVILNGKIYGGTFFAGGEIGHHVIVVNGQQCTCGRRGCFEAYTSATALIRESMSAAKNPSSKIYELAGGDLNKINAKTPFDAAELGDDGAKEIINNYIQYIAEGITNLINILQPEIIVIGGGVAAQGDKLLNPLRALVDSRVYGKNGNKTIIKAAELGNDAGIIGAAMLTPIITE